MNTDTLILLVSAVVLVALVGVGLAVTGAADYRKAQRRIERQRSVTGPDSATDSPPAQVTPVAVKETAEEQTAEGDEPR
jgi:hypothetical protein